MAEASQLLEEAYEALARTHFHEVRELLHQLQELQTEDPEVTARCVDLEIQLRLYERVEGLLRDAENRMRESRFDEVPQLLRQARELASENPEVAVHCAKLEDEWHREVNRRSEEAAQYLQRARDDYANALASNDFEAILQTLSQGAELIGHFSSLVPNADNLLHQFEELKTRTQLALDAINSFSAYDGLLKIREFTQEQSEDPTLRTLAQRLEEQVQAEMPDLLRRADLALEVGDLTEALDLLRKAYQLRPDDMEISTRYTRLRRRQRLEEQLREAEVDCAAKLSTQSLADAHSALRQGLETLLDAEADLPEEAYEVLIELVQLCDREGKLGQDEHWLTAQNLLARLGRSGSQNWAARRAAQVADQWVRLGRDIAVQGIIASATALGNMLEAYRAAATYLMGHPRNDEAIRQEAMTRERLINQVNESASKRLSRAQDALEQGEFQIALDNLTDIEQGFYGPVQQEFPGLLDGYDEVERLRAEAEQLKARAERLQKLHAQAQPYLDKASVAFMEGEWEKAENLLLAILDLGPVPHLARQVEDLRERIAEARIEWARKVFHEILTPAQVSLQVATTFDDLKQIEGSLESLPERVDLGTLPTEERKQYFQVLDEVRMQREQLIELVSLEAQAERAWEAGDYTLALYAMERALAYTREGEKRATLQTRLEKVRALAAQEQERRERLRQGHEAFARGEYVEAHRELSHALELGAHVEELLEAARVGMLLVSARRAWEEKEDWEKAQLELEEALTLAKENPKAEELAQEAHRLQVRFKEYREIQGELSASRSALLNGDLETAQERVEAVLKRAPSYRKVHMEARDLQNQIQRIRKARALFEEAQNAMEVGQYDKAYALVTITLESILPDYVEAQALLKQIEQVRESQRQEKLEQEIETLLKKAREYFQHRHFVTSQGTLDEIITVLGELSEERRPSWEIQRLALQDDVNAASEVFSDYSQARVHLLEGQKEGQLGSLREAEALLEKVIRYPSRNDVIRAIQEEAKELMQGILMGTYMLEGDLEEVEKRLITMLVLDPHNTSIVLSLHRVQATGYLRGFAEQAEQIHKMARRQATGWYLASLLSATIFSGLFIYAILLLILTRPNETLSYLTPLYTFIPGILGAVFFNQSTQANRRLDEEQEKLWGQLEEFEKRQMSEIEAIPAQAQNETQNQEMITSPEQVDNIESE